MNITNKKSAVLFSIFTIALLGFLVIDKKLFLNSNKLIISGLKDNIAQPKPQEPGDNQSVSPQEVKQEESSPKEEKIENKDKQSESIPEQKNPSNSQSISVVNKYVSWGYEKPEKARMIDTIIIHSSYNALGGDPYNIESLLKEYRQYGVSAHYVIDREGKIYQLVSEKNIAYHAGVSKVPDGRTSVNNFSIGIELMNKEDSKFTDEQYNSLKNLITDIKSRYKIKYILGHSQIAPGRKTDPWNFEWDKIIR